MPRPPVEVADVIRAAGDSFFDRSRGWFSWLHRKALNAILFCRTAALGGHVDECSRCGHRTISFNSCRNRHCPKCRGSQRSAWVEARELELLPMQPGDVQATSADIEKSRRLLAILVLTSRESNVKLEIANCLILEADLTFKLSEIYDRLKLA